MDESRKQFENFMKNETGHSLWRTEFPATKFEDQQYKDHITNMAWIAWQASREAIEIKAPRFIGSREALAKGYTVDYSNGFGDGMDAYEAAILAAGIKVKE